MLRLRLLAASTATTVAAAADDYVCPLHAVSWRSRPHHSLAVGVRVAQRVQKKSATLRK